MKQFRECISVTAFGILISVAAGCSSSMQLSGTPGMQFSGHYTAGGDSMAVLGTVPAVYKARKRLDSCEFRKRSFEGDLILVVHRGLFTGSVIAPKGTVGVAARKRGFLYEMEVVP